MLVAGVLVMAPAAPLEIRTLRLDALRRWLQQLVNSSACESGLLFNERDIHSLARKNEWHEHGLAPAMFIGRQATQSIAAIDHLFNGNFQVSIVREDRESPSVRRLLT